MGPYATSEEALAAAQKEYDAIKWISEHEMAIAGSLLFGGVMYMSMKHPAEMSGVLHAMTSLISESVKGTGEVIRGVGEIIPG